MTLPSEASGRRAVQLSDPSHYVEFTLNSPANGIVVRFSIPDTPDGSGNVAYLGVYDNARMILNLTVTSKFSWAYGNYPFTKNPRDGLAHHFYDETRGILPYSLPAGSKVRLSPLTSGLTYTIDLADFYTVPQPYPKPTSNYLDVTDYGADPTGRRDSTNAIEQTINLAKGQNKNVWIPAGSFLVSNRFCCLNKIIIRGAGPWHTTVFTNVAAGVGFFGNWGGADSDAGLYDFAILGHTNVRNDNSIDSGCGGSYTNSIIQNLWIEHTKCGMWLDGPFSGLQIVGVTIRNTYADGINFHKGITNSVVENSILRNLGDDALAMWSDAEPDAQNIFRQNTIQNPVLANGIGIYGGHDNSATNNYIADTICEGSGLQASNRFGSVPLAGTTRFSGNVLVRCGSPNHSNTDHSGAIWLWPEQAPMNSEVDFNNITIIDSSFSGVTFWGSQLTNTHFADVTIDTAPYAIEVRGLTGKAYFTNVVARNLAKGGVYSCDPGFQLVKVSGDSGWDDTHC
eukprot:TRINITY_DN15991_c0_g1_i1.p1 TRINITY_DN15991_c0_g1~~TRINITY_DN15991_c0_g1_i1.p1  ORF type:complete len:511 (-),score=84.29 TRINITY_DN15991_c0_g1_i1:58-1590(-)